MNTERQLFRAYGRLSGLSAGASPVCFPKAAAFVFLRPIAIFLARPARIFGADEPLTLLQDGGGLIGHLEFSLGFQPLARSERPALIDINDEYAGLAGERQQRGLRSRAHTVRADFKPA